MKAMLSAVCEKAGRIVLLIVSQVLGGVIVGIVVAAVIGIFIAVRQSGEPRWGDWHCSTRQVKTVELADIHFDVQAQECAAGDRHVQTTTAISASRRGQDQPTKIFEYLASRRGDAELRIELVDARTVRIAMPGDERAGREDGEARYMGFRNWENMTFIYR
jgi:hypothetical protein